MIAEIIILFMALLFFIIGILVIKSGVFSFVFKDSSSVSVKHSRNTIINKNLIKDIIISAKCFLSIKAGSYNLTCCIINSDMKMPYLIFNPIIRELASIWIISPAYLHLGRLGWVSSLSIMAIASLIVFLTFSEEVLLIFILNCFFIFFCLFSGFWRKNPFNS